MLGTIEEATLIRDWQVERLNAFDFDRYGEGPEGWTRVGTGLSRVAYLAPSGVVYKVQLHEVCYQTNKGEANALRRYWFTRMPKGCRLPRFRFYDLTGGGGGVMAMEYLGALLHHCEPEAERIRLKALQGELQELMWDVTDLHSWNLAVDEDGLLVPIDLAS